MATIVTKNGKFTVEFEALAASGKPAHFQSIYKGSGKPVAIRRPDTRDMRERFKQRHKDRKRTTEQQGFYGVYSFGSYLAFIDKLKSEHTLYLNWRGKNARSYRRVSIGKVGFHIYGRRPHPNISDVVFTGGHFFVAWMKDSRSTSDLMLSRIDPEDGRLMDKVVAQKMGLVTLTSLANIGTRGLIVCHRAMLGGEDAKIEVYPVSLRTTS